MSKYISKRASSSKCLQPKASRALMQTKCLSFCECRRHECHCLTLLILLLLLLPAFKTAASIVSSLHHCDLNGGHIVSIVVIVRAFFIHDSFVVAFLLLSLFLSVSGCSPGQGLRNGGQVNSFISMICVVGDMAYALVGPLGGFLLTVACSRAFRGCRCHGWTALDQGFSTDWVSSKSVE